MAIFAHPYALFALAKGPFLGMLQRRDVDGETCLVLAVSRRGDISLVVAFVGTHLILIRAIGRVDHQCSIGLFLAFLLHGHECLNHGRSCLLVFIAVALLKRRQRVGLVFFVKVMEPIDQHEVTLAGVTRSSHFKPVQIGSDVDQRNNAIQCDTCRISLVVSEVTVKVIGDKVPLVDDGVGDGVVFAACNERISLFVGQHCSQGAGLVYGIPQLVNLTFVTETIDNTLATLDKDQQHQQRSDGARCRQPSVVAVNPSLDQALDMFLSDLHYRLARFAISKSSRGRWQ